MSTYGKGAAQQFLLILLAVAFLAVAAFVMFSGRKSISTVTQPGMESSADLNNARKELDNSDTTQIDKDLIQLNSQTSY